MTQAEIEAEFGSLRARLSQLEEEQQLRTEHWRKLGLEYKVYSLVFSAVGAAFALLALWFQPAFRTPMAITFIFLGMSLGMLVRALRVVPNKRS